MSAQLLRQKLDHSIETIRTTIAQSKMPAVLCSFGKDSMVMLSCIREAGYKLPIIFHRDPWQPEKHAFANQVIEDWGLVVHDWPPIVVGIKRNEQALEIVSRYQWSDFGSIDLPKNMEPPDEDNLVCGLDIIRRPRSSFISPWDMFFHGHKSSDYDPYMGSVPLTVDIRIGVGTPSICFPLREWTDADIWDFIEMNDVPFQKDRYENRAEFEDKSTNSDYIQACTACIDPLGPASVFCPKFNREVGNVSASIMKLDYSPSYIGAEGGK